MYAIIETGGKQYTVSEGDIIRVEKIQAQPGENISFEKILFIKDDEGNVKVGTPYLSGSRVQVEVIDHGKAKKIRVFKYKRRKNYRRTQGHRQAYTKIKIEKIEG